MQLWYLTSNFPCMRRLHVEICLMQSLRRAGAQL